MILVVIGYRDWAFGESAGFGVRDLALVQALSQFENISEIIYLSRPISRAEVLARRKFPPNFKDPDLIASGMRWLVRASRDIHKVKVVEAFLPDIFAPLLKGRAWWNDSLQHSFVNEALVAALGGRQAACVLNFVPFVRNLPACLFGVPVVFDCIDNFMRHRRVTRGVELNACANGYTHWGSEARAITGVSRSAIDALSEDGTVIKNAVRIPENAESKNRKWGTPLVFGSGGFFFEKFHHELLDEVASRRSSDTFFLAGKIMSSGLRRVISRRSNIQFVGFMSHSAVLDFYRKIDIGFMFYRPNMENDGDPLKMYEMLASGTPVITLPSCGTSVFDDVVIKISDAFEFDLAVTRLHCTDKDLIASSCYSAVSNDHTWVNRARVLCRVIENVVKVD